MNINTDSEPLQALKKELLRSIRSKKRHARWDNRFSNFFLWLAIMASFSAAIVIAADTSVPIAKIWVAVIAGVPGLAVVLEKTFDFARRNSWDTMYKLELQELQDAIDFNAIGPYEAARKFRTICRRNEGFLLKNPVFLKEEAKEIREERHEQEDLLLAKRMNGRS